MRPYDFPLGEAPISGVAQCPELAEAIRACDYRDLEDWDASDICRCEHGPVEDIGRYRLSGTREAYVYRLQSLRTPKGRTWWHAYGEYCPLGRSVTDADYVFLDGGGYFSDRAAALWAIHLWLAHLHRADVPAVAADANPHGD